MLSAAEKAKIKKKGIMDHVVIATEPECASVVARKTVELSKGTKYIVLDLGGGTADIACHVAVDEHTVNQIYPPQGGCWGSSYIDEAFFKLLKQIFGEELVDDFKRGQPNRWVSIKENFRNSKHLYGGNEKVCVSLDNAFVKFIDKNHDDEMDDIFDEFEYDGETGLIECDEGVLEISPRIWDDLFNSVVQPLLNTTDEILKAKEMEGCQDILIVGGLSQSVFVCNRIRDKYADRGYRIHTVTRPILAVVEGAATIGLRPSSVANWLAPETMGIQIRRDYDESTDDESMKKWDKFSTKYVIDCGFWPLIKKGTPIDPSAPPKIEWFRPWKGDSQAHVRIKLYRSDEMNPHHTSEPAEGEKVIDLPPDWKKTEAFPVAYWDKGAEKKMYVAVRDWPEEEREIKLAWKDPLCS